MSLQLPLLWLWLIVACWRLLLAVFVRTSFDPDEYWQGPEVAHRLVFGYGHLTWEWAAGLRSYVHPLLFTPAYTLLKLVSEDTTLAVQLAPRISQVLLTLAHDDCLLTFAAAHLPAHLHTSVWLVSCISWFNCFTHSRPYSNTVESTLHLACLANWPLATNDAASYSSGKRRRLQRAIAIALAGLCCTIRPSSVVLFLPLAVAELVMLWCGAADRLMPDCSQTSKRRRSSQHIMCKMQSCALFLFDGLALAGVVIAASCAVDYAFYGRFVFPAWVNLEFNVLQNSSANYGSHPFHWYFSQGIPAMLASLLPLLGWGAASAVRRSGAGVGMPLWPLMLATWGIAIHSLLAHKEFRFVLPSFELLLLYAAVPVAGCLQASVAGGEGKVDADAAADVRDTVPAPEQRKPEEHLRHRLRNRHTFQPVAAKREQVPAVQSKKPKVQRQAWQAAAVCVCCLLQLPVLAFFGLVHQRGTMAVMERLSQARLPSDFCAYLKTLCPVTSPAAGGQTPVLLDDVCGSGPHETNILQIIVWVFKLSTKKCRLPTADKDYVLFLTLIRHSLSRLHQLTKTEGSFVLFLTNCHATPWQAHMHRQDVHMSFLDCSPSQWYEATKVQNAHGAIGSFSIDTGGQPDLTEQQSFELDPLAALCRVYGCGESSDGKLQECQGKEGCGEVPSHIVAYDDMARTIMPFLQQHKFQLEWSHVQNQFDAVYVELYTRS